MKFSIIATFLFMAFSAQALKSDSYLEIRGANDVASGDYVRRSDAVRELTMRELVLELEDRLQRRDHDKHHEFRDAALAKAVRRVSSVKARVHAIKERVQGGSVASDAPAGVPDTSADPSLPANG
ncbi:hypothetical protein CVT24_001308 [Panaeolus cyanescens]|uniref:Uncharacterized protein n=1 Tax=Panaeolus cyanescens TaxID=181874 RepID=A0A409YYW7_9AGAR|nr:hypothetical protein CVT24_001308 [Panaeolus cyanescens]